MVNSSAKIFSIAESSFGRSILLLIGKCFAKFLILEYLRIWTQGLRKKLDSGRKHHDFQADHGLRRWFKTRCEISGMKPVNVETLMNHSVGISDSYYRATESDLLDDYLNAIDSDNIARK